MKTGTAGLLCSIILFVCFWYSTEGKYEAFVANGMVHKPPLREINDVSVDGGPLATMDRVLAAFGVVAYPLCVSSAQVQIQRCLLSRLDFVECQYKNKRLIRAGSNEFSIHHTMLREGQSGFVECLVRRTNQFVDDIPDLGTKEMRIIYSSGFIREENYDNQLLMEYNVECGEDELAYFNVTNIDIEGDENCKDTNGNPRCQDYIQIDRGSFGTTELCGNIAFQNEPRNLERGRFKIIFRTSEVTRKPGFRMFVVCFKPEERDLPGCFEADEFSNASVCMEPGSGGALTEFMEDRRRRGAGDDVMTDELDSYGFRMRRDLVEFHKRWQRMKREAGVVTFVERNILYNEAVRFANRSLIVLDVYNTEIVRYEDVYRLETFDETGVQRAFFENDDGIPTPGPGPLYIIGKVAFFQLFVIDPRGLIPDEQEAMELQRMNEELLNAVPLSSDPNVTDPNQQMADIDFPGLLDRRRRQGLPDNTEDAMEVDEEAVFAAFRNREACNPVLRAQSRATLTYYRGINSNAVDALETFPIECNVDDLMFLSCSSVNATIPGRTQCTLGEEVFPCDESFMLPMDISEFVGDQTHYTVTVTAVNCNGQTAMDTVTRWM